MIDLTKAAKLGIGNPALLGRKLSQTYNHLRTDVDYNPDGIDVFKQDWDSLILLDACRYDLFAEHADFPGELRMVTSRGSATPEFLRGNFHGRRLTDTVYVTANPMLYRHSDKVDVTLHDVIDLWAGDTWDDEQGTVLPEVVATEAKRAQERYPNKRLLVHFMQPHYPFLGSDLGFGTGHVGPESPENLTPWMQVMAGRVDLTHEELWESYEENLLRTLPHVHELVESLAGKTVITSDHGNMFGERSAPIPIREWGHPSSIWIDELVRVPWIEIPATERKEINEEPNVSGHTESEAVIERLESLGYRE